MLCKNPYMVGSIPFGCGQCLPCRINRRRQWMFRQVFESLQHEFNSFVTLTYTPDTLPLNGSLNPYDLQLWLKRIRKRCHPRRLRYYAVGEYGERSHRPHYHLSVFGLSSFCQVGTTDFQTVVQETWGLGRTQTAEFNSKTANYCTGYISKNQSRVREATEVVTESGEIIERYPEFARMSLKPGLGVNAISHIAEQLKKNKWVWDKMHTEQDVPPTVHFGGREVALGRYMLNNLREQIGFTAAIIKNTKGKAAYDKSVEMSLLFEAAFANKEAQTYTDVYRAQNQQRILQVEARSRIFNPQRTL